MKAWIFTVVVMLLTDAVWAVGPPPPGPGPGGGGTNVVVAPTNSLAGATGGPTQTVSSVRRNTGFISLNGLYGLGQTSQYGRGVATTSIGAYRANALRDKGTPSGSVSIRPVADPAQPGDGGDHFLRASLRLGRIRIYTPPNP